MTLTQNEQRKRQATSYPENANYILYETIWAIGIVTVCLITALALVSHSS